MARKLAVELHNCIQNEAQLFDLRLTLVPPLLILDRRNDPVTPILSQWTYQAMIFVLSLRYASVQAAFLEHPASQEITLTTSTDLFFQAHHLATIGDLGIALKSHETICGGVSGILTGGSVGKHVALVGELSRLVDRDALLELGEVEQGLATRAGADLKAFNIASLTSLTLQNGVRQEDARVTIPRCLTFRDMISTHLKAGVCSSQYRGADHRQDDFYSTESLLALGRSALKGLKGVENVYMQHTPHLSETPENLFKGKLKESGHAYLESAGPNAGLQSLQDVIVFVIGDITCEEARTVALLNQEPTSGSTGGARFLLGGTCVNNSASLLEMIDLAAGRFPAAVYEPRPESGWSAPALDLNVGGTTEDAKVRTPTGAFLTLVTAAIILSFTLIEFLDYRRVDIDTSCYLSQVGQLRNDIDKLNEQRASGYCGSCYGGGDAQTSGGVDTDVERAIHVPLLPQDRIDTIPCPIVNSHQYSVTHFGRDLTTGQAGNTNEGLQIHHGTAGMPGVFLSYGEIPLILVAHRETRQSFAHFLISTRAIVGGVLTVGSILVNTLFATQCCLKQSAATIRHVSGKLM
ncbi:Sec1-like protein [Lactifluus subvellereus]|nr:Sec1-like protein [Lactifluus subvellereus]